MKKNIVTLFILLFLGAALPSIGQSKVGAGLAFGSETESLGIGVNGEFPTANSRIIISPSFILFFPDRINFWEINGNVNYVFSSSEATVYGILGLNIAHVGFEGVDGLGGGSDTDLGLNLGVGVNFDISSNITPFAEMKYAISEFDQLVIFGGVRFPIR